MKTWYQLEGLTGSGKTTVLEKLDALGAQVLNLEKISGHRGSSFGGNVFTSQITQKAFENELEEVINRFKDEPIFIESKPSLLGRLHVTQARALTWSGARIIYIQTPKEVRVRHIVATYGKQGIPFLKTSLYKLKNRLQPVIFTEALDRLDRNDLEGCAGILLEYYDASQGYRMPDAPFLVQRFQGAQRTAEVIFEKCHG